MKDPLPASFFLDRNNGNEVWIQFKLERLVDLCFSCGSLGHVRSMTKVPVIVTN